MGVLYGVIGADLGTAGYLILLEGGKVLVCNKDNAGRNRDDRVEDLDI